MGEPTKTGIRNYPPDGFYNANADPGVACTCKPSCSYACTGVCGCEACAESYGDYLSSE